MSEIYFAKNMLIKWLDRTEPYYWRLLRFYNDGVYIIETNHKILKWPTFQSVDSLRLVIEAKTAVIEQDYDPYLFLLLEDPGSEDAQQRLDHYWDVFKNYHDDERLYDRKQRGIVMEEINTALDVSPKVVKTLLLRLLKAGFMKNALLPTYFRCGGRGKKRNQDANKARLGRYRKEDTKMREQIESGQVLKSGIPKTTQIEEYFDEALATYFANRRKHPEATLSATYRFLLRKKFSEFIEEKNGVPVIKLGAERSIPSWDQFYEYAIKKDPEKINRGRFSDSYVDNNLRPLLGVAQDFAFEPGLVDIIDSTLLDTYCRSIINRNWVIGRPRLYLVIDGNCFFIRSVLLTLEEDGLLTNLLALEQAYTSHVEFCARYGYVITDDDWPFYIARLLLGDRAPALVNKQTDNIFPSLGVQLDNTGVYRAASKGPVEKGLDLVRSEVLVNIPGYVPRKRLRDDSSAAGLSRYTLDELYVVILKYVFEFNRRPLSNYPVTSLMLEHAVDLSPLGIISWQKNRNILLTKPRSIVRTTLLITAQAKVTSHGLILHGKLRYTCERAVKDQWFFKASLLGIRELDVLIHPNYTDVIFLKPNQKLGIEEPEQCTLINAMDMELNRGSSFADVRKYKEEMDSRSRANKHRILQSRIEVDATVEDMNKKADRAYKDNYDPNLKSSSTSNMELHRDMERELRRETDRWDELLPPRQTRPPQDPQNKEMDESKTNQSNPYREIWDRKRKDDNHHE